VVQRNQQALANSVRGLVWVAKSERMFREEIFVFIVVLLLVFGGIVKLGIGEYLLVSAFVMVTEILNTGLEKLCDRITSEQEEDIANIKDAGSAGVFLAKMVFIFYVLANVW
jgi:diacylglycerol kinase (ATP)